MLARKTPFSSHHWLPVQLLAAVVSLYVSTARAACDLSTIDAGSAHSVAVDSDGVAWAWGSNAFGQLGDGTATDSHYPTKVSGIVDAVAITAGGNHSLAILAGGTLVAWGSNSNGQLGDGTTVDSTTPVAVSGPPASVSIAIAAGDAHSVALRDDGKVFTWGANARGQLGDGTTVDSSVPVEVGGLLVGFTIAGVGAGGQHTIAFSELPAGSTFAWGANNQGQLGNNTTVDSSVPLDVDSVDETVSVAAGAAHSLAVSSSGVTLAWGDNDFGQLGDGTNVDSLEAILVSGLSDATRVAAGAEHSLALVTSGDLLAWGKNDFGQLGDGTQIDTNAPIPATQISAVASVGAGGSHSVAVETSSDGYAWGRGTSGQLGNHSTLPSSSPFGIAYFKLGAECSCRGVVEHMVGYTGPTSAGVLALLDGLSYATVIYDFETPIATDPGRGSYLVELDDPSYEPLFEVTVLGYSGTRYLDKNCSTFTTMGGGSGEPGICLPPPPDPFPNDPGYRKENNDCDFQTQHPSERYQWGAQHVGFEEGWQSVRFGIPRTVQVAVLDTGVTFTHPDFDQFLSFGETLDLVNGFYERLSETEWTYHDDLDSALDDHPRRHGTRVAGIIGAMTNNDREGIAGAGCFGCSFRAPRSVELDIYKVLDERSAGNPTHVAHGILEAIDNGAEVINLSLGSRSHHQLVQDAAHTAREAGALLVGSAGNFGDEEEIFPAAYGTVLAIGATLDELNNRPWWTNRGPGIALYAPGQEILSTAQTPWWEDNDYVYSAGTSFAAPMVSGAAALAWSMRNTGVTVGQVECALRDSAGPLVDIPNGIGLLNVPNLMSSVPPFPDSSPCDTIHPQVFPGSGPSGEPAWEGGIGLLGDVIQPSAI